MKGGVRNENNKREVLEMKKNERKLLEMMKTIKGRHQERKATKGKVTGTKKKIKEKC